MQSSCLQGHQSCTYSYLFSSLSKLWVIKGTYNNVLLVWYSVHISKELIVIFIISARAIIIYRQTC